MTGKVTLPTGWRCWSLVLNTLVVLAFSVSCIGNHGPGNTNTEKASGKGNNASAKAPRTVQLMPYWVTTAQFAGYYVGIEKGIFLKHGIDLEIMKFDPFTDTRHDIASGHADFALLWLTNAVKLRSEGVEIVNIAQLSTRSSLMLLAKKSSGIRKLSDLN